MCTLCTCPFVQMTVGVESNCWVSSSVILYFVFGGIVSHRPGVHQLGWAGLLGPPVSASPVLGWQTCTILPVTKPGTPEPSIQVLESELGSLHFYTVRPSLQSLTGALGVTQAVS